MPPSVLSHPGVTETAQSRTKRKAEAISQDTNDVPLFTPWITDMALWPNVPPVELLNLEATSFVQYISPTKAEKRVRNLVIQWIRDEIVKHIPDAEVIPFGSTPIEMYLPSGDIDLVVRSRTLAAEGPPRFSVARIANILRNTNMVLDEVRVFASAKVPILKFISRHGKFSVDVTVNSSNGVAAATIIKDFVQDIPAVKPLSLIVKCFLRSKDANEVYKGGLSSYLAVCMVIFFLQTHKGIRESRFDPLACLGNLFLDFLWHFGHDFNYLKSGISLKNGGKIFPRSERHWMYKTSQSRLCIEDPQNVELDAGAGIHDIRRIQALFANAYEELDLEMKPKDDLLPVTEGNSMLRAVMGIPLNEIEQRKYLAALCATGRLYRLLNLPQTEEFITDAKENPSRHLVSAAPVDFSTMMVHAEANAPT